MATRISDLPEVTYPSLTTNAYVPVVVGGITRKTFLSNVLALATGGTVTNVTPGTNMSVNSQGSPTKTLSVSFSMPGVVVPYAGITDTAPSGWLWCNGQSFSTTTYSALFGVIGYTYGGSGSSFNVPDLRGRIPMGAGSSLGGSGGLENVSLTSSQVGMRQHSHTASGSITIYGPTTESAFESEGRTRWTAYDRLGVLYASSGIGYAPSKISVPYSDSVFSSSSSANASQPHNNMPPVMVLKYLIKA